MLLSRAALVFLVSVFVGASARGVAQQTPGRTDKVSKPAQVSSRGPVPQRLPPLSYVCPMREDAEIVEDKPGKCPKCGMTLIPVMEKPSAEESATQLYTCPMASHVDVVSDKPGDCPKCGMKLVPTGNVAHGKVAEENWRREHPH